MPIEDDLRDALRRGANSAEPPGDAWERMQTAPGARPPGGSRIAVIAVAAVIGLGGVWLAVAAFDRGGPVLPRSSSTPSLSDPAALPLLRGAGTVISPHGDEKAYLCLGGVMTSLPPQCGGPEIIGWDWDAVDGEERASGTTWGSYGVIGTYDGEVFTLDEVVPPGPSTEHDPDFTAPCQEPAGGWVDVDPSTAARSDFDDAARAASREPDATATWIDYLVDPVGEDVGPFVAVFGFTGDLERHERELRAIWGGPMCVFAQERTADELHAIQNDLGNGGAEAVGLELTFTSIDVITNRVEVGAYVTSPAIQQTLDERFGEGVVVVMPALTPL